MSKITDFLASVKLTIVLLALLAATSIIGTVIPQQESYQDYARYYGEQTAALFYKLYLTDMYRAPWFVFLLALLAVNLLVCSIKRFPTTWRTYKAKPRMKPGDFANMSIRAEKTVKKLPEGAEDAVQEFMRKKMGAPQAVRFDNGVLFFAERGRWSRFGVYVVHLSVIIIFLGAIMGAVYGFKGMVNITEGDTVDTIYLRGDSEPKQLDFSIRCDKFLVEFYPSGAPKEFRSDLTFLQDGQKELSAPVLVNHPVSYGGVTFYQSSYGKTMGGDAVIEVSDVSNGKKHEVTGEINQDLVIPDHLGKIRIVDSREDVMNFGPAVKIQALEGMGKPIAFWVFKKQPPFVQRPDGPLRFQLKDLQETYYTGLQANHDPGVWLVYTGFCLMILGLILAFFFSHRLLWVQIRKRDQGWQIIMAGSSNKNKPGYQRTFEAWSPSILNLKG